jgi:hypothetical protein
MRLTNLSSPWQSVTALAVAVSAACATQTEASMDSFVTPDGVGGTGVSGTTGTGGSTLGAGGTASGGMSPGGTVEGTGGSDTSSTGGTGGGASGRASVGSGATTTGGRGGRSSTTTAGGRTSTTTAGGRTSTTTTAGRSSRSGTTNAQGGAATAGSGCAKLSVPLNAASDKAHFVTSLTTAIDLSRATISMRYYVEAGSGGVIFNYIQDSGNHFLGATMRTAIAMSTGTWDTVTWDVGTEAAGTTGIMKTAVKRIGIEVNASGSTTWANPTVIYVDSITVTTPARSFSFAAATSVSTMPASTDVASQALWLNSSATDTTAARTALSWQASCP